MTDQSIVVQTLRELGITRTEAEVYVATLRESGGGPVSGYRVAQSVGKDPANLSKTLASLEKLGAVRTIQDKPRLYVPLPPAEFTDKLLADMKGNQIKVLDQLSELEISTPRGIPMALHNQEQSLLKATQLMGLCRRELLIFSDKAVLESLGSSLEALAASSDVNVNILCLEKLGWPGLNEIVIPLPVGFSDPQPVPWLQMIIDRQTWLTASFPSAGTDKLPCGWWSEDPSLALIMGASLSAAMETNVEVSIEIPEVHTVVAEPEPEIQMETTMIPEEPVAVEPAPAVEPEPEPAPTPPAQAKALPEEDDEDDGIQFIIRHDEENTSAADEPEEDQKD